MCRIISIVNMKGGVGKSTTAVNLGVGLAKQGKRVLLLDCDSQGSLTASLGFRKPSLLEPSIATVMASIIEEDEVQDPILHHREGVDLVPANETLKGVELALVNVMSRELILKEYVSGLRPDYDYIILDCAPSLGLMTINALACADSVLIPVQAAKLALDGLQELIRTIGKIRRQINPDLTIEGVLITMVNPRTKYARETMEMLRNSYGDKIHIFRKFIPYTVRLEETPAEGVSIYRHDANGKAAAAYLELTKEVLDNEK